MRTLRGIAACPGAAVGPAYVYSPDTYEIPGSPIVDPEKAIVQLNEALDAVAAELDEAATDATGESSDILKAQAVMARDPALRAAAAEQIRAGKHPARAILEAGGTFARALEGTGNEYLAARAPDVLHICDVSARALADAPPRLPPHPIEPCVLVANNLSPADTAGLDRGLTRAFVTEEGSETSHTAVIARSLGVPAVVGVRGLLAAIRAGEEIGVDGISGEVHVRPGEETIRHLQEATEEVLRRRDRLRSAVGKGPTTTADGLRIEVAANIRSVEELRVALAEGAEGVGLLRTELLYLDRTRPPTVAEQANLLRQMHALLDGRRLVVRTFDIGSDKPVPFLPVRLERNPELGLRGLRLGRIHPDLLDAQLRAIAQVSSLGPTAVMAPMVSVVEDVIWFRDRVRAAGVPDSVEVGIMVEVPSAVFLAKELTRDVAFVSVGTNDLGQYIHAADRRHPGLSALRDPFSPALLRALQLICRSKRPECWVGVCGEAASNPAWALLAVGLGVTELSMEAFAIAAVRAQLRRVTFERCREAAAEALRATHPTEARAIGESLLEEET